ncbi:MAG TPA: TonB-dependent receptor [Bacteroidales bacterium]|jgi:TonB-linked SusC/RagA family outer membrane protein|nr:TonB-dependent receptor [Bacteroidales bacterium]
MLSGKLHRIVLILGLILISKFTLLSQTFDINISNGTVEDVFNLIEEQSNYNIFYKVGQIDVAKEISLYAKSISITQVLDNLISQFDASYTIYGDMIVITPSKNLKKREKHIVTGTVVSASDGQPLIGVNVLQEGTRNGTTTDLHGRFTLDTDSSNATLLLSFVGYVTQRIPIEGKSVIDARLYVDIARLDEVIVVGYGGQKRGDVTGSVSSLSGWELSGKGYISFDQMIQGKAAGVEVINNSGLPGAGVSIKIRGAGTIYNTDPLYVIDGLTFRGNGDEQSNPLATINPNDIESIQILKDASTAAIYGTRAANGVIIITTRRGRTGMPRFNFSSYTGITNARKRIDVLNSAEYLDLMKDIQANGSPGKSLEDLLPQKLYDNGSFTPYALTDRTDWQDEIFRIGRIQDHSLSVSGGNGYFVYALSGGYSKHEGIIIGSQFERYSFRSNTEFKLLKRLKIGENLGVSFIKLYPVDGDLFLAALRIPPYLPVEDPNNLGGFAKVTSINDLNDAMNPVAKVRLAEKENKDFRLLGNMYASWEILKGLTYRATFNLDYTHSYHYSFIRENENGNLKSPSILYESYEWGISPNIEHILEFNNSNEKRAISIIAGNTMPVKSTGRYLAAEGRGFSNDQIRVMPVAESTKIDGNETGAWQGVLISYFGRFNYIFDDRYLFTANFRRDASPRFSPDNRWGNFPSFSAGWKVSQEPFFKMWSTGISNLKFRAGWGRSGSDLIGDYAYEPILHSSKINYVFGYPQASVKGVTVNSLPSLGAKWETASNFDMGIDLGLFKNHLTFVADYFTKNTHNILVQLPIAPSVGLGLNDGGGDPTINAASVLNKGVEASLALQNNDGRFRYNFRANISYFSNRVTSLGQGQPLIDGNYDFGYSTTRTEVGKPIGYFFGFRVDRVYSDQEEINADNLMAAEKTGIPGMLYQEAAKPGDLRFKDLNNDGRITDMDREMIGNPAPDFIYGLSGSLAYKGFDISFTFFGVHGNEVFNAFYTYWLTGMIRPFNASDDVLDRWREPGDVTSMPRAIANDPNKNLRPSDRYIEDGSYQRLKNISIGFTLSERTLSSLSLLGITSFRVYITGHNLLTMTKYRGYDPEIGSQFSGDSQRYNLRRGIDVGQYPQARSVLFGVNVSF